jgi:hypothetical protein
VGGSCLEARPGAERLGAKRPDIVQRYSERRPCRVLRRRFSAAGLVFAQQLEDTAPDDVLGAFVVFHGPVRARAPRGVLVVAARLECVMGREVVCTKRAAWAVWAFAGATPTKSRAETALRTRDRHTAGRNRVTGDVVEARVIGSVARGSIGHALCVCPRQ